MAQPTATAAKIPLTIDLTQTDLPAGTDVYAYIVGLVASGNGNDYYFVNGSLAPQAMSLGDNTQAANTFPNMGALDAAAQAALQPNYPTNWADYSIPLSVGDTTVIDLAQFAANMPNLGTGTSAFSGRIYISVGMPKVPFTPTATPPSTIVSGYAAPVVGTGGPGALCLFDWIEFSWDSNNNFNGNTTQVDQFGFVLTLDGTPGGTLQGPMNTSRLEVMASVETLPSPFTSGLLTVPVPAQAASAYPSGIDYLRAMSPKTLTGPATYAGPVATFFDNTIASWYDHWSQNPLLINDRATGTYTGLVGSAALDFYQGTYTLAQLQSTNPPPIAFSLTGVNPVIGGTTYVISSYDVWQCTNILASGSAAQQNVGKNLAAAFNRGFVSDSLDDTTCAGDKDQFYPTGGVFNPWSQLFHQVSSNGLAYGFPYDDVCDQNPSIGLSGTTAVTITVGNFFSSQSAARVSRKMDPAFA